MPSEAYSESGDSQVLKRLQAKLEADVALARVYAAARQLVRLIAGGAHPQLVQDATDKLDRLVGDADNATARVAGEWRSLRAVLVVDRGAR